MFLKFWSKTRQTHHKSTNCSSKFWIVWKSGKRIHKLTSLLWCKIHCMRCISACIFMLEKSVKNMFCRNAEKKKAKVCISKYNFLHNASCHISFSRLAIEKNLDEKWTLFEFPALVSYREKLNTAGIRANSVK